MTAAPTSADRHGSPDPPGRPQGSLPTGPSEPGGAHSAMSTVDALFFVFAGVAAGWLAYLLLAESIGLSWQLLLLVVFWLLVAYLLLPRLHRVLTYVYVPGYFIGRTRTSDGLLGDPVNLAFRGDDAQVHTALRAAGWTLADEVTFTSSARIVRTTLSRRPYPEAPVSPLYLFERRQDFAYQQEVNGNPSQRHHVRLWRCPDGWRLPGGHQVDWIAAGTFDRSVGLSLWTLQVTHRIAQDIDVERDHIVATVTESNPRTSVEHIPHFASGYHARNGGGDQMVTDGDLPIVDLGAVVAPAAARHQPATDVPTKRPPSIVFSATVACLRGLVTLGLTWAILTDAGTSTALLGTSRSAAAAVGAVALVVVAVLDIGLGIATYAGRNWARLVLMALDAVSIVIAFAVTANGAARPTLSTSLPQVALGILVLLALTSPKARQYTTGHASRRRVG